jgi:regulator of replication initiation timing
METVITGVVGVVVAFLTHLITKRKYTSEVESSNIQNMQNSLDFYKDMDDDKKARLNDYLDQIEGLVENQKKLEAENSQMRIAIANNQAENARLKKDVETLKSEKKHLQHEIDLIKAVKEEADKAKAENQSLRLENQTLRKEIDKLMTVSKSKRTKKE